MKQFFILFIFLCFKLTSQVIFEEIRLPKEINETSGLEFIGSNIVTVNDSGGKPVLYEFNEKGEIINRIKILDFDNNDWESLAVDDKYIYVADIGNNFSMRTNLSILKIKLSDYKVDGKINFSYKDQNSFTPNPYGEFDAEGITCVDDKLILFSKNRKDLSTEVYLIEKSPGDYIIEKIGSFMVEGLITGADYNKGLNLMMLIGYDFSYNQFLIELNNFSIDNIDLLEPKKYLIPIAKAQMEGIKIIDENTFWVSSEDESKNSFPRLFKIKI